jgi:hypothetical protein
VIFLVVENYLLNFKHAERCSDSSEIIAACHNGTEELILLVVNGEFRSDPETAFITKSCSKANEKTRRIWRHNGRSCRNDTSNCRKI